MNDQSVENLIQGLSILVVDSNSQVRRLTCTMVMNLGAKLVLEANDGLAALEAIRSHDPDGMFIEWDMPVLGAGSEVHRALALRVPAPQSAARYAD